MMSKSPVNAKDRRIMILFFHDKGCNEKEALDNIKALGGGYSSISPEDVKLWFERFKSGKRDLELDAPEETPEPEHPTEPEQSTSEQKAQPKLETPTDEDEEEEPVPDYLKLLLQLPIEQREQLFQNSTSRRFFICQAFLKGMTENETMDFFTKNAGLKKDLVEMEEIKYINKTLTLAGKWDFETPCEELKEHSLVCWDVNYKSITFAKLLYFHIREKNAKIVHNLEIISVAQSQKTSVKVRINENETFYEARYSEDDHIKDSMIAVLTVLELCHEQNVTIQRFTLRLDTEEGAPDLLKMFLEHEIFGKVNFETVNIIGSGTVVNSLKVAKYVKCRGLTIIMNRFEYGRAKEFVKAMRSCHPDLKECTIATEKEIPHYFFYWKRFDDFDVTLHAQANQINFKKCEKAIMPNCPENPIQEDENLPILPEEEVQKNEGLESKRPLKTPKPEQPAKPEESTLEHPEFDHLQSLFRMSMEQKEARFRVTGCRQFYIYKALKQGMTMNKTRDFFKKKVGLKKNPITMEEIKFIQKLIESDDNLNFDASLETPKPKQPSEPEQSTSKQDGPVKLGAPSEVVDGNGELEFNKTLEISTTENPEMTMELEMSTLEQDEPSKTPPPSPDKQYMPLKIKLLDTRLMSKEELKMLQKKELESPTHQRVMVVHGYQMGMNENETMNWIKDITGKRKCPVGMDEIKYCYRRLDKRKTINMEAPLEELLEQEKQEQVIQAPRSSPSKLPDQTKTLHNIFSTLMTNRPKIIEEMEIGSFEHRQETAVRVQICGCSWKSATYKNRDHVENSLIDILAFLELCHEQNVKIKSLKLVIEATPDFLKMFVESEIVGKIRVGKFHVVDKKRMVVDLLEVVKYVKSEELSITCNGFEYGGADKLVEIMKHCHPGLKGCIIRTSEEVPHYLYFWSDFDDFEVVTSKNCMEFQRF